MILLKEFYVRHDASEGWCRHLSLGNLVKHMHMNIGICLINLLDVKIYTIYH